MTRLSIFLVAAALGWSGANFASAEQPVQPDFTRDIAPIFAKYCVGCHNAADREGELSLESFRDLRKGGAGGTIIIAGRADASRLVRVLSGEFEPVMPPEGNERPTDAEIAKLREWIEAGAKGPDGTESEFPELSAPVIEPANNVREPLTGLALAPDGTRLALGRYRHVDVLGIEDNRIVARSESLSGKVNSIDFSKDGSLFVAASGIPGLYGVATICRTADGSTASQIKGHRDALYDAQFSPNGELIATCSHDRQINIWNVASGELIRTLPGHNGAVFDVDFSTDGSILASASADGTVKIWRVATGERLDTLGQPEGEQCAVAISPDDAWIVAGGADRQVRKWRLISRDAAGINPLVSSRTAHDSTIVQLSFSPDGSMLVSASEGGELILWDAEKLIPIRRYETQPDVVTGIAFAPRGESFYIAHIDGSWKRYTTESGGEVDIAHEGNSVKERAAVKTVADDSSAFDGTEQEPNGSPAAANPISATSVVRGVIGSTNGNGEPDIDMFRFRARQGQQLVLEINAARQKSPLDSHLAVLDAEGNPTPRVLLQAVRPTYFTFRGHDSTSLSDFRLHKWQDMELNEYLYANGEVVKLWMYPRGPDSGFLVYPGVDGNRYTYFGTSSVTHALNEPCYIVQPHVPGTKLIPNGLPEFTLYYENDDDGWRKLGADSRVTFTAPNDGDYLVRVSDIRSLGGDEYKYELVVREPRPDFQIKVKPEDLSINAGSGKEFSVVADRIDDFDGDIHIETDGLPPGFHASKPLVIQAGQTTAYGTITADPDAPAPTDANNKLAKLTASAIINGKQLVKEPVVLGELKLAPRPKLLVHVLASKQSATDSAKSATSSQPVELSIAPGQTISAIVRLERKGFDGEVVLGGDHAGRNLPHGVFVDNIGLNGLTLLVGETEREFFITAAKWVPETTHLFHLRAEVEGNQTSWPVVLHVRNPKAVAVSTPEENRALSSAQ